MEVAQFLVIYFMLPLFRLTLGLYKFIITRLDKFSTVNYRLLCSVQVIGD